MMVMSMELYNDSSSCSIILALLIMMSSHLISFLPIL